MDEDIFSADAERKTIEVAFMQRLVSALQAMRERGAPAVTVGQNLRLMQSGVFAAIARELEAGVPAERGFGRFRGLGSAGTGIQPRER